MSATNAATSLKHNIVLMKVAHPPVPGDLPSQIPGDNCETSIQIA